MTLKEKQFLFAECLARLLVWVLARGTQVSVDEGYRPPETAALYAREGRGSKNSLHCLKLAQDLNFFQQGKLLTTLEGYKEAGEFWKSLHPYCRWGGDFKRLVDPRHFSIAHEGRA